MNAKVLVNVVDITIDSAEWVSHQHRFLTESGAQLGTIGIDDPVQGEVEMITPKDLCFGVNQLRVCLRVSRDGDAGPSPSSDVTDSCAVINPTC